MELISVIIPVYNTAEYLSRCLDSVLNNTYQNLEVICINDGSTDNSAEVLESYAQEDSRMVIINQKNAGVSAARNAGLDRATGDFIAFVDSDDWVHLHCFEHFIRVQEAYDADVVSCNFVRSYANDSVDAAEIKDARLLSVQEALENAQLKRVVCGKMYKRELLQSIRFDTNLSYGEDTTFNLLLYAQYQDMHIAQITEAFYVYFAGGGESLSTAASWKQKCQLIFWLLNNYEKSQNIHVQRMFIEQACKDTLAGRYEALITGDSDALAGFRHLLCVCKAELKKRNLLSKKKRFCFKVFFLVPLAYRIFRIIKDPTMLTWERLVRERKQECKNEENSFLDP